MINGPWHYHEAERLLARVAYDAPPETHADLIALAAVHAQLAQTAAAVAAMCSGLTPNAEEAWRGVLHTKVLGGDPPPFEERANSTW